jgi:hypothetical protein
MVKAVAAETKRGKPSSDGTSPEAARRAKLARRVLASQRPAAAENPGDESKSPAFRAGL